MITGTGIDIVQCSRMEGKDEGFLKHILSREELLSGRTDPEYLSSRFAAKEAFSKALGTGIRGFSMTEITVREDELGRPYFFLEGRAAELADGLTFHLSITHEREYAAAVVIAEKY